MPPVGQAPGRDWVRGMGLKVKDALFAGKPGKGRRGLFLGWDGGGEQGWGISATGLTIGRRAGLGLGDCGFRRRLIGFGGEVDELNQGEFGGVAGADARAQDTGVAPVTLLKEGSDVLEHLVNGRLFTKL